MNVEKAAAEGRLPGLLALRDSLAARIDSPGEKDSVAALAKELRATLAEVEALQKLVPKGSVVDELGKRRADKARKPDAAGGRPA